MIKDDEKWLSVDPGESVGHSTWLGTEKIDGNTTPMKEFEDAVWRAVFQPLTGEDIQEEDLAYGFQGICRLVVEDWKIYPWEAKRGAMDWDSCRTARLIGALKSIADHGGLEFVLQPAKIKERAVAAGAESLFITPLYENRHENDSALHGVYYVACHTEKFVHVPGVIGPHTQEDIA